MKKIALILVALLMTFSSIAVAVEIPWYYICGDYRYIRLNDGTAKIEDYLGISTKVSVDIPRNMDGCVVTVIGDLAFYDCRFLEISIPDSVTSIGNLAFQSCTSLTEITIPDSVTSIGKNAFAGCKSLKKCIIPDSVTSIGDRAFIGCDSLTLIVDRDSYAEQYAKKNNIRYTYNDATTHTDATMGLVEFEPVMIPFLNTTIREWYEGSSTRALFTVALVVEMGVHLEKENKDTINLEKLYSNPSYIGKSGSNILQVYIDDDMHKLIVMYDFSTDTVWYGYLDGFSDSLIQLAFASVSDSYYENDSDDLIDMHYEYLKFVYKLLEDY